ncbi:hypothetical protein D3C72_1720010 [compost metagenome]
MVSLQAHEGTGRRRAARSIYTGRLHIAQGLYACRWYRTGQVTGQVIIIQGVMVLLRLHAMLQRINGVLRKIPGHGIAQTGFNRIDISKVQLLTLLYGCHHTTTFTTQGINALQFLSVIILQHHILQFTAAGNREVGKAGYGNRIRTFCHQHIKAIYIGSAFYGIHRWTYTKHSILLWQCDHLIGWCDIDII